MKVTSNTKSWQVAPVAARTSFQWRRVQDMGSGEQQPLSVGGYEKQDASSGKVHLGHGAQSSWQADHGSVWQLWSLHLDL